MDVNSSLVLLFMFSFANLRKATEGEKYSAECVQHLCVFTVAMRRSFFFFSRREEKQKCHLDVLKAEKKERLHLTWYSFVFSPFLGVQNSVAREHLLRSEERRVG